MTDEKSKLVALLALCLVGLFLFGCASQKEQQNQTQNENTTIANPASVYCIQNGGVSKIVTAADGSQSGLCVFPNGSQCDEWAYYRGECSPANQTTAQNLSANLTAIDESDFLVVDDSMPNLFTTPEPSEAPAPN